MTGTASGVEDAASHAVAEGSRLVVTLAGSAVGAATKRAVDFEHDRAVTTPGATVVAFATAPAPNHG